jgi:hypothetical protein
LSCFADCAPIDDGCSPVPVGSEDTGGNDASDEGKTSAIEAGDASVASDSSDATEGDQTSDAPPPGEAGD